MVLVVFLIFALFFLQWRSRLANWRGAFLTASITWGLLLVTLTELLSRFNAITPWGLFTGWCVGGLAVCLITHAVPKLEARPAPPPPERILRWIAGYLILIATILMLVAWMGPPNNDDALTYHLSRVFHWMQDRNVEFYPVKYFPAQLDLLQFYRSQQIRQLTMPPGAEYIILNLRVLSDSQRLSTMVQWFAYIGCLIGVWSVAELLGAAPLGQALAMLFAATAPIVCLEATTAQNDLVCAFWLICALWAALRIIKLCGNSVAFNLLACGVSLGLALLTKATAYLFAAPFLILLAARLLSRFKQPGLLRLGVVAAAALLINLPMFVRNYRLSGVFIGNAADNLLYSNHAISPAFTASNIIRNLASELVIPFRDFPLRTEALARTMHHWLGINADDPHSTYRLRTFRDIGNKDWFVEDNAPNPLHVALLAISTFIALKSVRRWGWMPASQLLAASAAFILFSAYLRWQPWQSRLLVGWLLLASPAVGFVLDKSPRWLALTTALLLSTAVVPWIVLNSHHPLVGPAAIYKLDREKRFFIARPELQAPFEQVADYAAAHGIRQAGIIFSDDDWEYLLAEMLRQRIPGVRVETYPQKYVLDPKTINHGWDENLKPYLIVRFEKLTPKIVGGS